MKNNTITIKDSTEQNRCFNFLKGIGCFGIVFIHVVFPTQFGLIVKLLATFVVPMFFMISGYFAYNNDHEIVAKKIPYKIKNIFNITLIAILFYCLYPLLIFLHRNGTSSILEIVISKISFKNFFSVFILGNFQFLGADHLWFLPSLIYCYIFLLIINKFNLYKLAFYLIPILFISKIIITGLSDNWHYTSNFLFSGIPYFMTGNFLALTFKNSVTKLENPKLVVLIWGGFFFSLLGLYINTPVNIFYMGTILYSIAIFIYAYNNPNKYFNKSFEIIGAKYSLFIYIVHIFIYSCIEKLAGKANLKDNPVYQWSKPFIVAITTLVCAILFYRIFDIIKNKKRTIA